jgi:mRNA-degrading endonuclease toxin of MazEF toxin-antitoxin module
LSPGKRLGLSFGLTSLAIVCPLTSRDKGYPFAVSVGARAESDAIHGFILVD